MSEKMTINVMDRASDKLSLILKNHIDKISDDVKDLIDSAQDLLLSHMYTLKDRQKE